MYVALWSGALARLTSGAYIVLFLAARRLRAI